MAGAVKVKHKHTIPMILDGDKLDDFKKAIKNKPIGEFFRQLQYDIVEEYRKNVEAQENPLGLPKDNCGQSTLDQYQINPFRSDQYQLEEIKNFLMFQATEDQITSAAIIGNNIARHARNARNNYQRRAIIKR